jgi:hypothetical protein
MVIGHNEWLALIIFEGVTVSRERRCLYLFL